MPRKKLQAVPVTQKEMKDMQKKMYVELKGIGKVLTTLAKRLIKLEKTVEKLTTKTPKTKKSTRTARATKSATLNGEARV